MRLGMNPNRKAKVSPISPIVVLAITHLPEMTSDYHRGRLEVVKRSLKTLTDNINMEPEEYDLIVWDNGSCQELREWLDTWACKRMYSCNIGKVNALKMAMRMLPPGSILAYGDDDIEYMPDWLRPQLKILETFPNVGTVTGWPVRLSSMWGIESTKKWMHTEGALQTIGRFIPDEWERDYCESVHRDYEEYRTATWAQPDYLLGYQGVSAYAMSQHCQFVCYPERVERFVEWTDNAMADEISFDKRVDAAGLLRLATVDRLTRHMGNVLEAV